jgi:hypothetical protein
MYIKSLKMKPWERTCYHPSTDYGQWGIGPGINPGGGNVGADLASATTITPTHGIHRVSGTTAIETITVPYTGYSGTICLIATGAWSMTTAGNIAKAVTMVASEAIMLTYHPDAAKWYPHISDGA